MLIEVIQHRSDFLSVSEMVIDQLTQNLCKIRLRALGRHLGVSPAHTRLKEHEQIEVAVALILVVITGRASGLNR